MRGQSQPPPFPDKVTEALCRWPHSLTHRTSLRLWPWGTLSPHIFCLDIPFQYDTQTLPLFIHSLYTSLSLSLKKRQNSASIDIEENVYTHTVVGRNVRKCYSSGEVSHPANQQAANPLSRKSLREDTHPSAAEKSKCRLMLTWFKSHSAATWLCVHPWALMRILHLVFIRAWQK